MEVQTSGTPSGGSNPAAASSSEHTAAAQASAPPQVTVSPSGTPSASKASDSSGSWLDSFDSDTKEYVTQKGFKDPKAILESYRNLEKLRGVPQDRLLKLPEASDAPEWGQVFEKLGKPATPEGYGFKPKDPNNNAFTDWAKGTFHKLNLTTQQGQELVQQFNAYNEQLEAGAREAHTAAVQTQTMGLKKEWGAAFNQNVGRAQSAYRQLGIPDKAIDSLEREIGFDGVMKLFNSLGSRMGEHEFVNGDSRPAFGEGTVLTPDQAKARIKALKQDNNWVQKYLAKDTKAVAEMERLMRMSNPTD